MRPSASRSWFARAWATVAIILVAGFATGFSDAAEAEPDFEIQTWERHSGLPPKAINEVQRAPNGYLWIATERGLVRFDGNRFKLFDADSNPELRSNRVNTVFADARGGIWVGTFGALLYYPSGVPGVGKFIELGAQAAVYGLTAGADDSIWAVCRSNEVIRIANEKIAERFNVPGDQPVRAVFHNKDGLMLTAPYGAVLLRDGKLFSLPRELAARVKPNVLCASRHGGFWVASEATVSLLTETDGTFQLERVENSGEFPQSAITVLMEDRVGRLWVGTRQGAVHCYQSGLGWRQVTPQRARTGYVQCLYEDAEGLIWAGTTSGYLHQIKRRQVTVWSLPARAQDTVPHTVCVSRNGSVWVGTDGAGAYRYDSGNVTRFGMEQGLSNLTVIAILEDEQTNLWFGTMRGLFRFEQNQFKSELEGYIGDRTVAAMMQSHDGDLWFGTVGAVIRKRGDDVQSYRLGGAMDDTEVRAITEDKSGRIWIGTRGAGLFRLEDERFERYQEFPRPVVNTIYCDSRGTLWVGTGARGLFRLRGKHPPNWGTSDGLPSGWVNSILEDANDTLWIGSSEGVFGVRKPALMERWRSKASPLVTIHVATSDLENWSAGSGQPSAAKAPDGRLWFPLGHGVLSFHPAELMRERPSFPVLIEELLVDNVERVANPDAPVMKLYTGMKRLEFRFTIADLDSPGQLKFRYQLEGLDDKWINGGVQRSATYGPLPPGKYRFRVISAGSGDDWTKTANPLEIEIIPHFWQTAWFQISVALFVLIGVGATAHFIGRAKLRRKLERLQMQQAMEKERQRIARDLHDDLGSGITEIMLLSELAKGESKTGAVESGQMQSQLNTITQKARQVATAMDAIVWTVDPKNDCLPDLASYLCDYAREFLRAANVSCRIDVTEEFPPLPVTAQQRHNLFMAVKEALNNAVKHSGASEVWLRISWSDNQLTITVEDNGCGFDPANVNGSGNGLENMRARLTASGGRTEFRRRSEGGTAVLFSLPLQWQN